MMPTPVDVFIAHAQSDDELRRQLERRLEPLKRSKALAGWTAAGVGPGVARDAEGAARLAAARIVLILVSPEYLESQDLYAQEMAKAIARHRAGSSCVLPVLVRACSWARAPFAGLSMLPEASGMTTPLMSWSSQDEAWTSVLRAVRAAATRFARHPLTEAPVP